MTRLFAAVIAAMLALGALAVSPDEAEAGYWYRRHVVVTPVFRVPVGVVGASQLGSAYSDLRYGSYSAYYYHAPIYGYFSGPTYYYSRPAFFYPAPAYRARRVVHRTRVGCRCTR